MRPASIIWFERLFLLSLLLGLGNAILSFDSAVALVEADPVMAEMGWSGGFVMGVVAFSLGIPLLLTYLIARRASVVAKWVLVALVAIGFLMISFDTENMLSLANIGSAVAALLQLVAVTLLFRRDAVEWLGKPKGANPAA
ncbi:hypothetical protein [Qipengyuania flava]|uniref:hypothetical protein n=1 Tax=Qipengyuania flava TaxID=192812 RepID=UPI001C62DD81|nr:hypothetical protein [Qipengyuania flava]QYJ07371.1 hypothetical protein KUV82_01195 [Qipengyuania flava]